MTVSAGRSYAHPECGATRRSLCSSSASAHSHSTNSSTVVVDPAACSQTAACALWTVDSAQRVSISAPQKPVGELLRAWRERRRLSQLELALQADISTRHLSFVETGRSRPSSQMILRLTEHLDVPLRERNHLLLAGGFAPVFGEAPLDSPRMTAVRDAVRQILRGQEPYPAIVVDTAWNLVDANSGVGLFTVALPAELQEPPINVLRVSLHPNGLAPLIVNLGEWRGHLLGRLRRQLDITADSSVQAELEAYPCN
jgi:transcriptional regulator with XRE-family HTH domain